MQYPNKTLNKFQARQWRPTTHSLVPTDPLQHQLKKNKKKGHGRSAESSGHLTPSLLATSSSTSPLHERHGNLATNPCTGHSRVRLPLVEQARLIGSTSAQQTCQKKIHIQQQHYKLLLAPNHSRMLNKWQINSGSTWYIFSRKLSNLSATYADDLVSQ
jgi:hypothetical protein